MKEIKFSVIIPLAPWRSAEILDSLKKQDFPKKDYEIIIKKGTNVPENRNSGIKEAKGEIILFLDDDAIIESNFLTNVNRFFKKHPEIDILGGPQLTPSTDEFFARVTGYVLANNFACPGICKRYKKNKLNLNADSNYITGALMIVKRKVFDKLIFDPQIYPADDITFVEKAKKHEFKIATSPEIYIYHRRRAELKGLIKQIYDYAKVRIQAPFKKISDILLVVPTLFWIYLIALIPLLFIHKLFIIPLLIYMGLTLIFSAYEATINKSFFSFFLLPLIFFVIHISYGAGFLYGMIKK
ncbi:MAG: glycosyltransferase [Nanoarchaeota archaeon]